MQEASMHDHNCFVTLTYREDFISRSLRYRDFQLFMKRLRVWHKREFCKRVGCMPLDAKRFGYVEPRFFMCGEYGAEHNRAHFHAILFGVNFADRVRFTKSLYRSAVLERLWPYGFSSIGEVTYQSASYVAGYVVKKVVGRDAEEFYNGRCPEFAHMSLKPGIGASWLFKYMSDVYPTGQMVVNAKPGKPPRYYDKLYRRLERRLFFGDTSRYEAMKAARLERAEGLRADNTDARLAVKDVVTQASVRHLKRNAF